MKNLDLPVYIKSVLKVSGALKYVEISPDFDLKEHYIHTPDGNLSQVRSNPLLNT